MQKQISDFTVVELKSLAYDELAKIELAQNNIRILNQEITNRIQSQSQQTTGDFTSPPTATTETV
jgi:hypothetical protein